MYYILIKICVVTVFVNLQLKSICIGDEIVSKEEASRKYYTSVSFGGAEYKIGDCAYVEADAFGFDVKQSSTRLGKDSNHDEVNILKKWVMAVSVTKDACKYRE